MSKRLETEDQADFRERYEEAKRKATKVEKVDGEWRIFPPDISKEDKE